MMSDQQIVSNCPVVPDSRTVWSFVRVGQSLSPRILHIFHLIFWRVCRGRVMHWFGYRRAILVIAALIPTHGRRRTPCTRARVGVLPRGIDAWYQPMLALRGGATAPHLAAMRYHDGVWCGPWGRPCSRRGDPRRVVASMVATSNHSD